MNDDTAKVFGSYDQAALDKEYDNVAKIPADRLAAYRKQWALDSQRARDTLPCVLDLKYGDTEGEALDIFRPEGADRAPVQIYIHGGYWIGNDKRDCSYVAHGFVAAGFVTVIINYGLIPTVTMRDQVEQCRRALRWVQENIQRYGGDENRIYVTGHSAGGHLATMLLCDPEARPGSLKGIASLSGLYDLEPVRLCFVNQKLNLSEQDVAQLSPYRLSPTDTIPRLLLTVGGDEGPEYLRQMRCLEQAWSGCLAIRAAVMPGMDHFSMRAVLDDPASVVSRIIGDTLLDGAAAPNHRDGD